MTEFYRLQNILAWRVEYFTRILSMLDTMASEALVVDLFMRERKVLKYCVDAKVLDEVAKACELTLWACRVADAILNNEGLNAGFALGHIDRILGENYV